MRVIEVLAKRPAIGLVAFTLAFLGQWFRHSAFPLSRGLFGDYLYWVLPVIGTLGIVLVFRGMKLPEVRASWYGFVGGLLIWIGWFEWTFQFFGAFYQVPPYRATPWLVSPPDLNLIQASMPLLLVIFVLYGLFNRESKCNLMRWIHRNLRIDPGQPTPGHRRNFAQVTALETLFVIWFCYALWLYITFFGKTREIILGSLVVWGLWTAYLVYRLVRIPQPGYALRYGIAVGTIGWVLAATPSHMGLFPAVWLHPEDWPLLTVFAFALFVAGGLLVVRWPSRGAPGPRSAAG
jgi:hypothetical protein